MRTATAAPILTVLGLLHGAQLLGGSTPLDRRLIVARNVALGFDSGADFTMNEFSSDDRAALFGVRQEIERWGRYWIVSQRKDADLLIAIRVRGALVPPLGKTGLHRDGLFFPGSGAPRADMLSVYDARQTHLGVPLWRGVMFGGLSGDQPPLLESLRADVEELAKKP